MFFCRRGGKLLLNNYQTMKMLSSPGVSSLLLYNSLPPLCIRGRDFSTVGKKNTTDSSPSSPKRQREKELHELDLQNAKERKQFVRRINCEEDASSEKMLKAFNTYRELYIHDVRLSFKDLLTLIHNMINRYTWDHSVYRHMLDILYEYHSSSTAHDVILKMKDAGLPISADDYMNAIRVCTTEKNAYKIAFSIWSLMIADGHNPSRVDYEILMNCCIQSKAISEAEKVFELIRTRGLKPTVWTYNVLLTGYKKTQSWERALQIYQIMQLDKVEADGVTYSILLDLLFDCNKKEYAEAIISDIQKGTNYIEQISHNLNEKYPSHVLDSIHIYNCNEFIDNFDVIVNDPCVQEQHLAYTNLFLRKNHINALLRWFIEQDNRIAVLYLYKATQRSKKTSPNNITYKLLFHYCGIKQDIKLFEDIMKNAVSQGIKYNSSLIRDVSKYFLHVKQFEKGMELIRHSIDCLLLPDYRTQPFRLLLWKYSEATTFFAVYSFLYQFVKDYGERKLEGVRFHDVSIMGHTGLDELKGSRNVKIIQSMMNNLYPHINTTQTDDNRIILHLHSFMQYVREEGRRYQAFEKKGKKFELQMNVNKVIQECFSEISCEDSVE